MALLNSYFEIFLAGIALILTFVWLTNRKKKDPRYPPGPRQLPLIGNLHQLGSKPQQTLIKWAKEYGPIFSISMGNEDAIFLNDHKLIRDVFADFSSTGRTANPVFLAFANGNYGVIFAEGAHWEQRRRFTLRTLRDFGFAKTAMEGMILDEANSMLKWFDKHLNKPILGNRLFNGAVVNSLWNIISGERSEWDAEEQPTMLKQAGNLIQNINNLTSTGLIYLPKMRFIAPDYFGWTNWLKAIKAFTTSCQESTERHRAKLNPESPQDFIDHYLLEMKNETDPASSFHKETGEKNLTALIPDLFIAGSETTSNTLSWSLLFLAHNPKVQEKLQKELDTVVGPGRQPSISDKPNLPYAEATMNEVLRISSVVNNGVPHRMIQDAVFHGYFFPKNTTILANIYWVHNDPKVWGDPQNFRPERFLSPDEKTVIKHEAFLPFALGRRQCLGKSLAEDTLFLFLTCIFQRYTVKPDPSSTGEECKKVEPTAKLVNEAEPFKVVISRRVEE